MRRRASAVAALIAVAATAGCGGETKTVTETAAASVATSSSSASVPPPTTTTSSATNSTTSGPLQLGQSATFAGDQIIGSGAGEQVAVTVVKFVDPATQGIISLGVAAPPAPPGQRYVEVELKLDSEGTAAYSDSPGDELSLMSRSTGGPVGQAMPETTGPGQCATDLSTSVNIAPGQTERGCVYFQVPAGQKIDAVQYQTQGGDYQATWNVH